jgi:hypothetical protein
VSIEASNLRRREAAECGLAASQVIERPAEVFRFVATEHFEDHPKWDPGAYLHHQDLPSGRWDSEGPHG